jgi:hypothetical protein
MKQLSILTLLVLLIGCAYAPENLAKRAVAKSDARKSTSDWKLRHAQLERETGGAHWESGRAYDDRQEKLREMEKIERELLRRYRAGDKDAFLATFIKSERSSVRSGR